MTVVAWTLVPLIILTNLTLIVWLVWRLRRRWEGPRVVRCPEDGATAAVRIDCLRVVRTACVGRMSLRVRQCSHWPGRGACGRDCTRQLTIESADALL